MTLVAVPNISDGRDPDLITALSGVVAQSGATVLDLHVDPTHNRSVITATGGADELVAAMSALAVRAAETIDLEMHDGVHPRLGALDVCPFVPHDEPFSGAIAAARRTGRAIGKAGLPVYLYAAAALRPETVHLPDLRRGGLAGLMKRAAAGFDPDLGPSQIDPRAGVVCVGARGPLIAFNVNLDADLEQAQAIALSVRETSGGLPGVRALGLERPTGSQVSMNLVDPDETGINAAFAYIEREARKVGIEIVATEIVGLVADRYLPSPDAKAARLLVESGRSLETALRR